MTDIEEKAVALLNEVKVERGKLVYYDVINRNHDVVHEALCRAIERHEAFKQEVSDAIMSQYAAMAFVPPRLKTFIITKPDPLAQVLEDIGWGSDEEEVNNLRAGLEARGLEIREKGK